MKRAVVLFLVVLSSSACGGDEERAGGNPQAPPSVGDPTTSNARRAGVVVHVTTAGVGVPNVRVAFHNSAGSLVDFARTEANGTVRSPVAVAISQVTVVTADIGAGQSNFVTYTDVEDGDELTVENSVPPPLATTLSEWSFAVDEDVGAMAYRSGAWGCGHVWAETASAPFLIPASTACLPNGNVLLATAYSGNPARTIRFRVARDIALPAAGTTAGVTPESADWIDAKTFTVKVEGAPPDTEGNATVDLYMKSLKEELEFRANAGNLFGPEGQQSKFPPGIADSYIATASVAFDPWSELSVAEKNVIAPGDTDDKSVTFHWSDAPRPRVVSAQLTGKRPQLEWAFDRESVDFDGGTISIGWQNGDRSESGWWFVVSGHTARTVVAPQLPDELDSLLPPSRATRGGASLRFHEASAVADARAFRHLAFRLNANEDFLSNVVRGTVRTIAYRY